MVFQLDFKDPDPDHNIRMRLGNALAVCNLYGLFLHSSYFSASNGEAFLSYFGLKKYPFHTL